MLRHHNLLLEALLIEIENVAVLGVESTCAMRHSQEGDEAEISEKNHGCGSMKDGWIYGDENWSGTERRGREAGWASL